METLLRYGLLAVFAALVLAPLGLPIPEEISLLVAGVLGHNRDGSAFFALAVAYLGVSLGDSLSWLLGRRIGLHPTGFVARMIGAEQIEWIDSFYRKYGTLAIAIARQFPGMRFPTFFSAGAMGIPYRRFILVDWLASNITINVYFWLGYSFADDLDVVMVWIERMNTGVYVVLGLAAVAAVAFVIRRRRRRQQEV